jgi:hypothetical protein
LDLNAIQYFDRQQRLSEGDLIFVQTPCDVLKEGFLLIKKMIVNYQETIIKECQTLTDDYHRMSVLKSLLQTSKLKDSNTHDHLKIDLMVKEAFKSHDDKVKLLALEVRML